MAPDLDQLRAEIEGLRRANELLGQDYRKLFAVKAALDADNERLKAEVAQTYATLEDAVSKVLGERKQLRELREAHDLLHKRIEAYDETHAYLQELREAAEELADVCRGVHAAYEDSSAADEHGVQFIGDPLVKLEKALAKGGA
jgi:chromosome segregation ATPase